MVKGKLRKFVPGPIRRKLLKKKLDGEIVKSRKRVGSNLGERIGASSDLVIGRNKLRRAKKMGEPKDVVNRNESRLAEAEKKRDLAEGRFQDSRGRLKRLKKTREEL